MRKHQFNKLTLCKFNPINLENPKKDYEYKIVYSAFGKITKLKTLQEK
jgi:hypothetical protein